MPAQDGSNVVALGLVAGGVYLLYRWLSSSPAVSAPGGLPAAPSGPGAASSGVAPAAGPPTVQASAAAPVYNYNSLDQIFQRLQAALTASGVPLVQGQYVQTPWQFASFLARVSNADVTAAVGGADLWPGIDANNPPQITLAQFWSRVAPWLAKNKGFSGLGGLGFYGLMFRRARPI